MIRATILTLRILGQKLFLLTWTLDGDSEGGKFIVQRSESPGGTYINLATINDTEVQYLDEMPLSVRKYIPYCYRIKNPDSTYTNIVSTPVSPDKYILRYIETINRYLQRNVGEKSYYFRKLRKGIPCTACWDAVLGKSVNSECTICHGTGIVEGYTSPVECYIAYPPDSPTVINVGQIKYNVLAPQVWMSSYPRLYSGDVVIRDVDKEVFIVGDNIKTVGRKMYVARQIFSLQAIERGSVEFDLVNRIL